MKCTPESLRVKNLMADDTVRVDQAAPCGAACAVLHAAPYRGRLAPQVDPPELATSNYQMPALWTQLTDSAAVVERQAVCVPRPVWGGALSCRGA